MFYIEGFVLLQLFLNNTTFTNKYNSYMNIQYSITLLAHPSKTAFRSKISWPTQTIYRLILEVVDNFNYLGTVFSQNGFFKVIQDVRVGKGLNVLLINLKKYNSKPSIQCQLFDSFVGSILNYASEVLRYWYIS